MECVIRIEFAGPEEKNRVGEFAGTCHILVLILVVCSEEGRFVYSIVNFASY